ncbi:hypothetical protein GCM10011410_12250 [Hoyosella rhizosphaerae]|uniref:Uncharacterized protein n=1 Tax=Hoyosella rhizosphaerae TaxID=1755582 RepID=A0A916XCC4_9ACTN|nr:hypothetical protein GCM10011410_12250 [Hoyosella rhizosphaerae]
MRAADRCPNINWTVFTFAPAWIASEAAVCQSSYVVNPLKLWVQGQWDWS